MRILILVVFSFCLLSPYEVFSQDRCDVNTQFYFPFGMYNSNQLEELVQDKKISKKLLKVSDYAYPIELHRIDYGRIYKGSGSFARNKKNEVFFVTSRHVIEKVLENTKEKQEYLISFYHNEKAYLLNWDEYYIEYDIIIFKVSRMDTSFIKVKDLPFIPKKKIPMHDMPVFHAGYPFQEESLSWTAGHLQEWWVFQNPEENPDPVKYVHDSSLKYILTNGIGEPGASGGPFYVFFEGDLYIGGVLVGFFDDLPEYAVLSQENEKWKNESLKYIEKQCSKISKGKGSEAMFRKLLAITRYTQKLGIVKSDFPYSILTCSFDKKIWQDAFLKSCDAFKVVEHYIPSSLMSRSSLPYHKVEWIQSDFVLNQER